MLNAPYTQAHTSSEIKICLVMNSWSMIMIHKVEINFCSRLRICLLTVSVHASTQFADESGHLKRNFQNRFLIILFFEHAQALIFVKSVGREFFFFFVFFCIWLLSVCLAVLLFLSLFFLFSLFLSLFLSMSLSLSVCLCLSEKRERFSVYLCLSSFSSLCCKVICHSSLIFRTLNGASNMFGEKWQ